MVEQHGLEASRLGGHALVDHQVRVGEAIGAPQKCKGGSPDMAWPSGSGFDAPAQFRGLRHQLLILLIRILEASQAGLKLIKSASGDGEVASQRFVAYSMIDFTDCKI